MRDMTTGSPARRILAFSLPLFIGSAFQQLYNIVDTIVVGQILGREALAAVGSAFVVVTFFSSIVIGLSMGASVLYAQLFGAKDLEGVKRAVFLSAVSILCFSVLLTGGLLLGTPAILAAFRMPPETLTYGTTYLQTIFCGLSFVAVFQISANVMRSIGDSKTPLLFLVISCVLNIGLDVFFVATLKLGVFGAALATVIAQGVSAALCAVFLFKKVTFLRYTSKDLRFDRPLFFQMARYALLTSAQQSVMNFGGILVQGLINTFGSAVMAAFAAGAKVNAFAHLPFQEFGNAFATYTAQNRGAKENDRILWGLRDMVKIIAVFGLLITVLIYGLAPLCIRAFVKAQDTQVIAIGVSYLHTEGLFYILIGFLTMYYAFYRGLGYAGISIWLSVVSLGTRVILSYALSQTAMGYTAVFWAIPIGWALADIVGTCIYRFRIRPRLLNSNDPN